jgi:prevent-host-death family protein
MVKTLDSNEARSTWRTVLDETGMGMTDTVVTRHGKPVVAIIRYEDFLALQEQLEELRADQRTAETYQRYQQSQVPTTPWSEIKARFIAEERLDE